MNKNHAHLVRSFATQWSQVIFFCAALSACGGGGVGLPSLNLAGGVGSGGTGFVEGLVSGFGSVIVDGIEYNDTNALAQTENELGALSITQVKLGQRVLLTQSTSGVASTIQTTPQLRGEITQSINGNGFQVLGQWVDINTQNSTAGNATVIEGFVSLSELIQHQSVEVHGTWSFDPNKNAHVLKASRLEKLNSPVATSILSGMVMQRNGNDLVINQANSNLRLHAQNPLSNTIQAGNYVRAWVTSKDWPGPILNALRVTDASPPLASGDSLLMSVPLSANALSNDQLQIQGLNVQVPPDLRVQVANAQGMVQLSVTNRSGVLTATQVQLPSNTPALNAQLIGRVEFKGAIVWHANPASLSVRDNLIFGTNAPGVLDRNCPEQSTLTPIAVDVIAKLGAPGSPLMAISVSCGPNPAGNLGNVIQQAGLLQSISLDGLSLGVLINQSVQTMRIMPNTVLPPPPNDLKNLLLNKTPIELEYEVVNGQNQLRALKPASNP
jgi:hypothetical protein